MAGKSARSRRFVVPIAVVALSLLLMVVLVACGEDEETIDPMPGTPTATPVDEGTPDPTPTPEAEDEGPDVRTASIANFALPSMTIEAGTVVRFVNNDAAPHTATEVDGAWDSGNLNEGESWEHEFSETGTFEYYCAVHPTMTGTITVE